MFFFCQRVKKQGFEKLAQLQYLKKGTAFLEKKNMILSPFFNYYSLSGQCKTVKKNESS